MPTNVERPLLLLDVDGVLSPTGSAVPPGYQRRATARYDVVIRPDHGVWLRRLADVYELTWATTWEDAANRVYADLFDLPPLPVIALGELPRSGTRKLAPVAAYAGERELAWIDDELYDDAHEWASGRQPRTLLVRTRGSVGLTERDFEQLQRFASTD